MTAHMPARSLGTPAEGHHIGHHDNGPHSDAQPLRVFVPGTPAPQGSKRHVGNGVMVESSKHVKTWRGDIRDVLIAHHGDTLTGPLDVTLTFVMPRPKSHYRTGRNAHLLRNTAPAYPAGKPDVDKLARAVLDAIGSAGVWGDDSQVVTLHATKRYARYAPSGCYITIRPTEEG